MRARQSVLALGLLIAPISATAESHKLKASAAGSNGQGQSSLWGGRITEEFAPWNKAYDPKVRQPFWKRISLVTEFSAHSGAHESGEIQLADRRAEALTTRTQYALLGGVRLTRGSRCFDVYAQALTGHIWNSDKLLDFPATKEKRWVWGAGAGIDLWVTEHGGFEAQVNVLTPYDSAAPFDSFVQLSLGVVIKFYDPK